MQFHFYSGRNNKLDGLRGLAILLVLAFHLFVYEPTGLVYKLGWTGVDLFFVLSGFLITGILLDSKTRPRYFSSFFLRRMLRIFPLYYGVLIVFLVFFKGFIHHPIYLLTFTQNIHVAFTNWDNPLLDHFWSLCIEEQFYLVWPFIVYFTKPRQLLMICLLICVAALALRLTSGDYDFNYVFTLTRADTLATGGLLATMARFKSHILDKHLKWILPLSLILLICSLKFEYYYMDTHTLFHNINYSLFAIFFAVLVGSAYWQPNSFFTAWMKWGWLRFLGKYSYGIYVFHHIIYQYCVLKLKLPDMPFGMKLSLSIGIASVSIIIAVLSFHLYEIRFLRLKRLV